MEHNLLSKLLQGKIKYRDLEKYTDPESARKIRKEYLKSRTEVNLDSFNNVGFNAEAVQNKNIENLFGSIEIPLGVAGPVKLNGNAGSGEFYLSLATTEGALVASVARGCKLINDAGGADVLLTKPGITRAPVFKVKNLSLIPKFKQWLESSTNELKKVATEANDHLELKSWKVHNLGRNVWLRLSYDTDEAMGMNMSTKASRAVCGYILNNFPGVELIALSGNLCSDKKMAKINALEGRGRSVTAEIELSHEQLKTGLHTNAQRFLEVVNVKTWYGSALSGAQTFNAHAANIIAAIFAATGQDLAHVVDTSLVYTTAESTNAGISISVTLPAVIMGYIGGGTSMPKQTAARDLMLADVNGKSVAGNKTDLLAQILAVAVLAGEVSLHGALAADELVKAHEELGRGKR